ncbi:MAG: sn-glycerol-3-phosphate ABC transporter ATP-binding protein UgpC [Acidobacteriota bacterium]|nr:sn-glycerol-3-phosphate ABC transporter ATP-binding protein UgpC [Acidobacteriota bacterium]
MAKLSLQAVSKTYRNGVQALAPVDLNVDDGQFVVLVGPSGCGKSTLLRIIAGLEELTTGSLLLDDVLINDLPAKNRDVAMVFQSYALYPHLTVQENLEFSLRMRNVGREQRRREVATVAEMLHLTELLDRKPSQLSGGQQQRVALGRAIVRRPKLFLLDEPFSNLDATLRASTRTELIRLHRRIRTTTVFVTHDQVEAMSMADVLVVMKDGKVQQVGAPLDVYRYPVNRFVAQFIGSPPMNLIEVSAEDDGRLIDIAGHRFPTPPNLGNIRGNITLGLRAEHIQIVDPNGSRAAAHLAPSKLILLEPLGNESLATCLLGGQDLIVRVPATSTVRLGQEVWLALDLTQAVWFDSLSGSTLDKHSVVLT